jgi:hypothetical protein
MAAPALPNTRQANTGSEPVRAIQLSKACRHPVEFTSEANQAVDVILSANTLSLKWSCK